MKRIYLLRREKGFFTVDDDVYPRLIQFRWLIDRRGFIYRFQYIRYAQKSSGGWRETTTSKIVSLSTEITGINFRKEKRGIRFNDGNRRNFTKANLLIVGSNSDSELISHKQFKQWEQRHYKSWQQE